MRNPNGYGGISKLPGNRRRPFRARVTVGWTEREGGRVQRYATIGYFATRGEAMMALADYNRAPWDTNARSMTFKNAFEQWSPAYFEKYPSTRRVTECAMVFCRQIWNLPIRDLRAWHLQEVIAGMDDKSRGYQSKVRSLMHMLYRWAMSRDITQRDMSQYVELTAAERESPRRVFTAEEVGLLWRKLREGESGVVASRYYTGLGLLESVLVLLYTGMRVGELLSLRREDVYTQARYIDLRGTKTRAARRTVPLHRRIVPVVERLLALPESDFLLPGNDGQGMTYSAYKGWFDKAMPALGMSHTPHDARHTFISALDTAGVRRGAVKFIAGHSQHDVTDRYTHKDLAELIREIDKMEYGCPGD